MGKTMEHEIETEIMWLYIGISVSNKDCIRVPLFMESTNSSDLWLVHVWLCPVL